MKSLYKGVILVVLAGITTMGFVSCDKANDWLVEEDPNVLFRPTEVTATVNAGVLTLAWKGKPRTNAYSAELSQDSLQFTQIKESFALKPPVRADGYSVIMNGVVLQAATRYSIRIKSVDTTAVVNESGWSAVTFTVPAEGLFSTVASADLTTTTAKLKWNQTVLATHIMIGTNRYNISATELAAGEKTIAGLTARTAYTAQIYYNDVQRGQIAFTTK